MRKSPRTGVKRTTVVALGLAIMALALLIVAFFRVEQRRADDALIPFLSSQVMVREVMVSGLRANDIGAFCDAYLEFKRIAREEPVTPEGSEPLTSERDAWTVRLLAIDLFLIPDLAYLSGFCGWDFPY